MTRKKPWQTLRARLGRASGIALSYTMFLFVCLALLVIIGFTYDSRVRDSYWQQQRSHLTRVSSGMESQLQLMSDYSLQLRTDTTLLRLSNMHDETDANYVLAAYRMMQSLTIRQYGLISLPVIRSTLYLKESNHILTSSESVPAELYYSRTRSFRASEYENWLAAMESAAAKPTFVDYGQFSGRNGELAVLMDISGAQLPSMPVVVAFELDGSALREYLLPENIADAAVYVLSADGTPLFSVGNAVALSPLTFDANQTAFQGDYRILRRLSPSGRQYLLQLPNSLANQATGQFLRIYLLIFLAALVVGALVIIQLIRRAMKPIRQLTTQLDEAEERRKDAAYAILKEYYEDLAGLLVPVVPYERIHEEKWLNKTFGEIKAKRAIDEKVAKVAHDWETLQSQKGLLPHYETAERTFFGTLDLGSALTAARAAQAADERIAELRDAVEERFEEPVPDTEPKAVPGERPEPAPAPAQPAPAPVAPPAPAPVAPPAPSPVAAPGGEYVPCVMVIAAASREQMQQIGRFCGSLSPRVTGKFITGTLEQAAEKERRQMGGFNG